MYSPPHERTNMMVYVELKCVDLCADTLTMWAVTGLADQRATSSDQQLCAVHCAHCAHFCTICKPAPAPTKHIVPSLRPLTSSSPQCLTAQLVIQSASASIPLCPLDIQDPITLCVHQDLKLFWKYILVLLKTL